MPLITALRGERQVPSVCPVFVVSSIQGYTVRLWQNNNMLAGSTAEREGGSQRAPQAFSRPSVDWGLFHRTLLCGALGIQSTVAIRKACVHV